ncbi:KDELC1 (predicted), partial [Pycnogonum litorale]
SIIFECSLHLCDAVSVVDFLFIPNFRWNDSSDILADMCMVLSITVLLKLLLTGVKCYDNYACEVSTGDNVVVVVVSPKNTLIFGPGLNPDFNVPARYFYIQAVDRAGVNLTESVGYFDVDISGAASNDICRVWTQVLDRQDGSYIVRYKLHETCVDGLHISVTYRSAPVAMSPYILKGPVYNEECYCPVSDPVVWTGSMFCPSNYSQVKDDLEHFGQVDMDQVVKSAMRKYHHAGSNSLCHYVVKRNQVYRKCYGEHIGFNIFMDNILLSLARKVTLPDIELLVNLGDWPLESKNSHLKPLPIFSWCGSEDSSDIVMPTYDITESTLETMGRVMLDMMSVQGNTGPTWDEKIELGFWRGRDSRRERLNLIKLGRKHPDLINASLTNFFFFTDEMEDYGPAVKHMSFFDFFKYKYQINIDGTVAAYRFPYLLAGDSVVLKQDSPYYEHFYRDLRPWEHFIPFRRDLSDLVDRIRWVKYHDEEARNIAKRGRQFAQQHLMPSNVLCYHLKLFQEYSKLLVKPVNIRAGMEWIRQPDDIRRNSLCQCLNQTIK